MLLRIKKHKDMSTVKTKWIQGDTVANCLSLYVNDQKTNVYYFTDKYKYFEPGQKEKALKTEQLILKGEVTAENDNWDMWDLCKCYILLNPEIVELPKDFKPVNFWNNAGGLTGYEKDKFNLEYIKTREKRIWSQLIKAINWETLTLQKRIGAIIHTYGYSLHFID